MHQLQPEDVITLNTIYWNMDDKERAYMVAFMYHEACHKSAAMLDAQGVHGPEVPASPQPEAEPTRVT